MDEYIDRAMTLDVPYVLNSILRSTETGADTGAEIQDVVAPKAMHVLDTVCVAGVDGDAAGLCHHFNQTNRSSQSHSEGSTSAAHDNSGSVADLIAHPTTQAMKESLAGSNIGKVNKHLFASTLLRHSIRHMFPHIACPFVNVLPKEFYYYSLERPKQSVLLLRPTLYTYV